MPQDFPRKGFECLEGVNGVDGVIGAGDASSSADTCFSKGDCAGGTSSSPTEAEIETALGRRCSRIDDLRRILCSTISESLLRLTTRCEISRKIEFALAIGDGEGESDRE